MKKKQLHMDSNENEILSVTHNGDSINHIKKSKKIIFFEGDEIVMKALEDFYTHPEVKIQVITRMYDPERDTESSSRPFADLTEFQKKRRVYNFYLRYITMNGVDTFQISIALTDFERNVLLELAFDEKMIVLTINASQMNVKDAVSNSTSKWRLFKKWLSRKKT